MTSSAVLRTLPALVAALLLLAGCPEDPAPAPTLAEGIFAPLGQALPSASPEQHAAFARGLAVSQRRFTPEDGLGPEFNLSSCAGCHEKPVAGGGGPRYRNFLLTHDELPGGSVVPTGVNGVQPQFSLIWSLRRPTDPSTDRMATRNPIPFFGVGLLAEIPEAEILKRADPDDADGDGISGRPNWDRGFVGRFGRKAQTVSIEGFIRGPLFNHLGVTSDPLSNALKAQLPVPSDLPADFTTTREALEGDLSTFHAAQAAAPDEPTVDFDDAPDPELSEGDLFDLVSFSMLLAAPAPDEPTEQSEAGAALFAEIGCDRCHAPALNGPRGLIPAYTDLLLHDMGDELADAVSMGVATGREFRTAPLWGIIAVAPYLHDGRADTLADAIAWHGGEGAASRDAYAALDETQRASLDAFLASLGGASQRSTGLLAPGTPVPAVGDWGGPVRELTASEQALFVAGREVFDRDQPIAAGLGPRFNGDSCRACHFDPVIGGAGPLDVNVTRQAIIDEASGAFTAPAMGTMAHRHGTAVDARPPVDPLANFFEARQTPSTLGLGLIGQISAATIRAGADPDDLDGDGIRGLARELPDGGVGRLGWKLGIANVEEFMRDALANECGLTLPDRGAAVQHPSDDDDAPDPEVGDADYDALLFYLESLAPPPRTRTEPALEDAGEEVFDRVGCGACHTPSLPAADGTPVPLYSDLLLHDVLAQGAWGVEDGAAGARAFRTAPLWGIGATAPYMHDGLASTLQAAIEAHDGTAAASRDAALALDAADAEALLAFLRSL